MCKWADDNGGPNNNWRPTVKGTRHPKAVQAKINELRDRKAARDLKLRSRDSQKRYYSKVAAASEKRTNVRLAKQGINITATVNSGRSFQDADHLVQFSAAAALSRITLDTKNQSKAAHPTVQLDELEKVRKDATRAGSLVGGLLIRNKFGRAVVVFAEEDLKVLFN